MKHRIFIAFPIPGEVVNKLVNWQATHRSLPFRWISKEGLHFTLLFIGYLTPQELAALAQVVASIAKTMSSFHVQLTRIQAGPPGKTARLAWVEANANIDLAPVKSALEKGLREASVPFKHESRPFHLHLTLGRLLQGRKVKQDECYDENLGLTFEVTSLDVMESLLSREGARYETLAKFSLSPPHQSQ